MKVEYKPVSSLVSEWFDTSCDSYEHFQILLYLTSQCCVDNSDRHFCVLPCTSKNKINCVLIVVIHCWSGLSYTLFIALQVCKLRELCILFMKM